MSKNPLKRGGTKQSTQAIDAPARHAFKKRKLGGEMKGVQSDQAREKLAGASKSASNEIPIEPQTAKESSTSVTEVPRNEHELDKRKIKSKSKQKHQHRVRWEITSGSTGRFLALDPIFAGGERHIILATSTTVQIYSCSTSLLVRSLAVTIDNKITTYALSPSDPDILYVGTFSGEITKWNWTTGELIRSLSGPPDLLNLVPSPTNPTDQRDCLFGIRRSNEQKKILSYLRLEKSGNIEEQILLERRHLSRELYLTKDSKVLVASAGQTILFGSVHLLSKPNSESKDTTWREFGLPEEVCSIDILERTKSASTKSKDAALDLAIGTRRGPILLYDDAFTKLLSKERQKERMTDEALLPRRLHWHRDMVKSVKWSKDGNYLISGGKETVLVIWQLDTLQKQYLPHLSSEITNITVSPAGTSYAVHLANNTSIVLATSELRPTASMSGLDVQPDQRGVGNKRPMPSACVGTVNPRRPEEILFVASSMLQTFDTRTLQNISRQALTRNSITEVNINPKGTNIEDPAVNNIAISHDGMWLATVDDWSPPAQDLEALHPQQSDSDSKHEVFLKFWRFNETEKIWELSARVDGPHSEGSSVLGSVLSLRSNPSRLEFATVGIDGLVKFWSSKGRSRDGQPVKDKTGQRLLDWSCRTSLKLNNSASDLVQEISLAYSEDGSVLAAAIKTSGQKSLPVIQVIDTVSGILQASLPITTSSNRNPNLAILGPYLISLGSTLQVFDLVRQTLAYVFPISTISGPNSLSRLHLAVNPVSQTFAITVPLDGRPAQTQIAVFTTEQARPLFSTVVNDSIVTLLAEKGGRTGYILIDQDAVIRHIQPTALTQSTLTTVTDLPEPELKLGLADMFGSSRRKSNIEGQTQPESQAMTDVGAASTTSLFGPRRPEHAGVTPVFELFEQVARSLVGRKQDRSGEEGSGVMELD